MGPVRVTEAGRDADGRTRLLWTRHFPLLLEGGRNWGVSLGRVDRLRVVPEPPATDGAAEPAGATPRNRWSWTVTRVRLSEPVVFTWRSLRGVRAEAGADSRGVSVGHHASTATRPARVGFYRLDFSEADPGATRLEFRETPPAEPSLSSQDTP